MSATLPPSVQAQVKQQVVQSLNDVAGATAETLLKGADAARQVAAGAEPERLADEAVSATLPPSLQAQVKEEVVQSLSDVAEARDARETPGRRLAEP